MNQILRLDSPIRFLKGVGPERARLLEELGVRTLLDLLRYFPRRYENRGPLRTISALECAEEKECVAARVFSAKTVRTKNGRIFFRAMLTDGRRRLIATWFNAPYLSGTIKPKCRLVLWGKAERSGESMHMAHPEFEVADSGNSFHFGRIVPVYPLIEELSQKNVRQLAWTAVRELASHVAERLPVDRVKALGFTGLGDAFRAIHFPESLAELERARARLVFDEFLALHVVIGLRRAARRVHRPELSMSRRAAVDEFIGALSFELTEGQRRAIGEILADMARPQPMNRLLQADVGSGKTVVAAAAIVQACSSGFQSAFLAPTEVLARQQMFALLRDLEPLGIRIGYLGRGAEDAPRTLEDLAAGRLDAVVGTHALLQGRVKFRNLGLAIVDEQHKFGVAQRAALRDAGGRPAHFLMLTATPIPRSLAMTLYGDLDISEMRERPAGRRPVRTARVDAAQRETAYLFLGQFLEKKEKAFVVCPALSRGAEGSRNALATAQELAARFPALRVACLHGRLKAPQKEKLVADFRAGKIKILVSTVVIEVGLDVPDANLMLIEDAERFGMAQLHQLRGRVGRGGGEAYCFLISGSSDPEAVERLDAFCRMPCGFDLAEKDLEMRGGGDWAGRRQHGLPEFALGDFARDKTILETARAEALRLLEEDPPLAMAKHRALRRMADDRLGKLPAGALSE